jgi:hypothetical protein
MGAILGSVISIGGSLLGGSQAASTALKGFNYLKKNEQGTVDQGNSANSDISALLTGGPNSPAAKSAFTNYLNSSGYNFEKSQGTGAITGSAAARGLLQSGSTAKALASYGTDLASEKFGNYISQLDTLSKNGLTAAGDIGAAGTQGGGTAAQAQAGASGAATGAASGAASQFYNFLTGGGSGAGSALLAANPISYI